MVQGKANRSGEKQRPLLTQIDGLARAWKWKKEILAISEIPQVKE